jgi:hypothetical protein
MCCKFMIELRVQIFQVREYKDWMSMTFLVYLSAFIMVLSPPNAENVLIANAINAQGYQ